MLVTDWKEERKTSSQQNAQRKAATLASSQDDSDGGSYSLGLLTHSIDAKECAKRVKTCDRFSAEGGREAKNFRCFVRER